MVDDAGQVGLEGHDLQVEHQLHVVGEEHRDARRLLDGRASRPGCPSRPSRSAARSRGPRSGTRRSCGGPTGPRSGRRRARALAHEVEDAPAVAQARRARAAGSSGRPPRRRGARRPSRGLISGGMGVVGAAPGEAVGVGAAVAGVAVAHRARVLAPELERGEAGQGGHLLGRDLVDGDAGLDVGPRRSSCGWTPVRKQAPRARVVAGAVPERVRVLVGQAGEHEQCRRGRARAASGSATARSRGPSPLGVQSARSRRSARR